MVPAFSLAKRHSMGNQWASYGSQYQEGPSPSLCYGQVQIRLQVSNYHLTTGKYLAQQTNNGLLGCAPFVIANNEHH